MTLSLLPVLFSCVLAFNVEAGANARYTVDIPFSVLRAYGDDIGLLARHMPGVVEIREVGQNRFLYRTRKSVPLASDLKIDFLIERSTEGDAIVYQSVRPDDENFMRCVVRVASVGAERSSVDISLSLRLRRDSGSDVHWMAPVVGEKFISSRMSDDLKEMLETYRTKSTEELMTRYKARREKL